jgi:riboflavin-specific deaminase-like protein
MNEDSRFPDARRAPRDDRRPTVTVHYAQTLDGRIATRTGHSQWISGEASLRLAHELRAGHQAVMVGIGTVLADNPRLTVRLVPGSSPRRIVVDSTLRIPLDAHVLADETSPTLVGTTARAPEERIRALEQRGAEVLVADQDPMGRVDLADLLRRLAARDLATVLVEGGARLITTALRERLVDRLVVCIAPKVIGAGIEAVGNLGILRLTEALTFERARFTLLGEDVVFDGAIERGPGDPRVPAP